jgi:hypothetical protein
VADRHLARTLALFVVAATLLAAGAAHADERTEARAHFK